MSEVEKTLMELFGYYNNENKFKNLDDIQAFTLNKGVRELLDLYQKEKEKNKQLEIELEIKKYCKVNELANDLIYYKNLAKEYQGNCISKDKIKVKEVICVQCKHRWLATRPSQTLLKQLECPNCNKQGYTIETGEEIL